MVCYRFEMKAQPKCNSSAEVVVASFEIAVCWSSSSALPNGTFILVRAVSCSLCISVSSERWPFLTLEKPREKWLLPTLYPKYPSLLAIPVLSVISWGNRWATAAVSISPDSCKTGSISRSRQPVFLACNRSHWKKWYSYPSRVRRTLRHLSIVFEAAEGYLLRQGKDCTSACLPSLPFVRSHDRVISSGEHY